MTKRSDPHSLNDYWNGVHSALDTRLKAIREYLKHPASGFNTEVYFRELLREYLPKRYLVDTGFVVNAAGMRSQFIDILICDSLNIAPLCSEPHFKIFAAESVVAAIEVTLAPGSKVGSGSKKVSKLTDDLLKIAKVREIAKEREYYDYVPFLSGNGTTSYHLRKIPITLCPRSFVITCGSEWQKRETYQRNLLSALREADSKGKEVWLNAALSMQHGMFHFTPYSHFDFKYIQRNTLLQFLLFINSAISSYQTFRIDVRRYRPTIPKESVADQSLNATNPANGD